jgi:hypothetical protein
MCRSAIRAALPLTAPWILSGGAVLACGLTMSPHVFASISRASSVHGERSGSPCEGAGLRREEYLLVHTHEECPLPGLSGAFESCARSRQA